MLDRPFYYNSDGHGSFFGVMARNYLRFGWTETHLMPLITAGQGPMASIVYYRDHPPMVPLLMDRLLHAAERRVSWRTAMATAALLVVMFAAWTSIATFREFYPAATPGPYTPVELGEAIRIAAPAPRDVALLVGGDNTPEAWFYGDRPLRRNVWTSDEFNRRLHDDTAETVYGLDEPWNAPAAGIVFPTSYRQVAIDLWKYLEERYPLAPLPPRLRDRFDVFDLRRH